MRYFREMYRELVLSQGGSVFSVWYFMCGVLVPVSVFVLLASNYADTVKAIEYFMRDFCGPMSDLSSGYCATVFSVRDTVVQNFKATRVEGLTRELVLFGFFVSCLNFAIQILTSFLFNAHWGNFKENTLRVEKFFHLRIEVVFCLAFLLFLSFWLYTIFGAMLPHDEINLKLSKQESSILEYFFYCFLGQYLVGISLSGLIVEFRSRVATYLSGGS